MSKHFNNQQQSKSATAEDATFSVSEALIFWNALLSGPLVEALQNESQPQLRATCCDCLANIGSTVFEAIEVCQLVSILGAECFGDRILVVSSNHSVLLCHECDMSVYFVVQQHQE